MSIYFKVGLLSLLMVTAIFYYWPNDERVLAEKINTCDQTEKNEVVQIDCWYELIREHFDEGGTVAAFDVFETIYATKESFANTGCHRHAHRVGDMAYYSDFLHHQDFDRTEFPENAKACGYGFYHGFFEHLVQDRPDPEFVVETCDYMTNRLYDVAPAIRQTCFHGAGHGFVLSLADKLTDSKDWTIEAFTKEPLNYCESLVGAEEGEVSECRQGVFNVLVDWMSDEEYGLTYNYEEPFAVCDNEEFRRQPDCYYEMAQKLDGVTSNNPVKVATIINETDRTDLGALVMGVAVAGMVQHNPESMQPDLLFSCRRLNGDLADICLGAIVGGLVEHDTSGDTYQTAINFCLQDTLNDEERAVCYDELHTKLSRFLTKEQMMAQCKGPIFPDEFCARVI